MKKTNKMCEKLSSYQYERIFVILKTKVRLTLIAWNLYSNILYIPNEELLNVDTIDWSSILHQKPILILANNPIHWKTACIIPIKKPSYIRIIYFFLMRKAQNYYLFYLVSTPLHRCVRLLFPVLSLTTECF